MPKEGSSWLIWRLQVTPSAWRCIDVTYMHRLYEGPNSANQNKKFGHLTGSWREAISYLIDIFINTGGNKAKC